MQIPSLYPCPPLSPHTYIQDSDAVGLDTAQNLYMEIGPQVVLLSNQISELPLTLFCFIKTLHNY